MIGIVAHERWQIEGHGESAATLGQQVLIALIGLFRGCKAGELPHGPEPAAVAAGMDAARLGRLTGIIQVLFIIPVFRQIGLGIKPADGNAADCGKAGVPILIKVDA
jgi:hypothetical protein